MKRGITLIEMLISIIVVALVVGASGRALITGLQFQQNLGSNRAELAKRQIFEDQLQDLIRHAYLSSDATDTRSYFIGGVASQTPDAAGTQQNEQLSGTGTDTITFSIIGRRLPGVALASVDTFENNNQKFGPVGGISEISLGTSPIGEGAAGQTGLFLRDQTPGDGDPSQGGFESLLSSEVVQIGFEFFDGLQWLTEWDTRTQTTKRLPSTVRVTYRFESDNEDHFMLIRIPASDVTPENPVTVGG